MNTEELTAREKVLNEGKQQIAASLLETAVGIIGPELNGNIPGPLYNFTRRYNPMFCTDVVLVPQGNTPSVILARRNNKAVAPGQYWIFGGRVDKGLDYFDVARTKVRNEIGIDMNVDARDIIGLGRTYFPPDTKEVTIRDHDISTPNLCLAKQIPITTQADLKINPEAGHDPIWRVFTSIDPTWHPYIINAVAYAWQHLHGVPARESAGDARGVIADPQYFIPLHTHF